MIKISAFYIINLLFFIKINQLLVIIENVLHKIIKYEKQIDI